MTRLLLVGATGLVGRMLVDRALADARISGLVAPTRRPLPGQAKLHNPLVDFDSLPEDADWWAVDAAICTLGTTMAKAGSQAAFRRVDHDYPLRTGAIARRHGVRRFVLLSSVGASARARSFYLRVKGETEAALAGLGFDSLTIVRPSVIGGRRAEARPGERAAMLLLQALRPVVPKRYRVVPAEAIAAALLEAAITAPPGTRIVESEELGGRGGFI